MDRGGAGDPLSFAALDIHAGCCEGACQWCTLLAGSHPPGLACHPSPATPLLCRLASQPDAVLLDVRPAEQFNICHLPGGTACTPSE